VTVALAVGRLRERSVAVYVSVAGGFVVDVTTKVAQPPLVVFGVESGPVVA
jgi:predicted sugar kinase